MKLQQAFMVGLLAFMLGCSHADSNRPAGEAGETGSAPTVSKAEREKGLLRIEPEMLRDLKVTTSPVEQRPGGEGAVLLGQLGVNENAYAQVGAPVPSRILALHAALGQAVDVGQGLATLQSSELGKARSELITANARSELARQTLERKRRLASEHIVSQREVQEAEANVSSTDADVRAARAALQALGVAVSSDGSADSSQYV